MTETNAITLPVHALTFIHKLKLLTLPEDIVTEGLTLSKPDQNVMGHINSNNNAKYQHSSQKNNFHNTLILGSFNTRSVYQREESIMKMMEEEKLAILGL